MNNLNPMQRRNFLKVLASSGLSSNILKSSSVAATMMMSRYAAAADTAPIKRAIFYFIPGGSLFRKEGPDKVKRNQFTPLNNNLVMRDSSKSLESIKNECVFFNDAFLSDEEGKGVGSHGQLYKTLGGVDRKNTYDYELSKAIGQDSPYPSLLLGAHSRMNGKPTCTKVNGRSVSYQDNPLAAYDRLFGNAPASDNDQATEQAKSVLDIQRQEIKQLRQALDANERLRLDQHLDAIEKIEQRFASAGNNGSCDLSQWQPGNYRYDKDDFTNFTADCDLQTDVALLALQCNLTKVLSFQINNSGQTIAVPELNYKGKYHASMHRNGEPAQYIEAREHLNKRFVRLVEGLKAAKDEQGNSLLDSTLVFMTTDMANGQAHSSDNTPMLLAGGGDAVKRGKVTSCGRHLNVLDTMSEALGVEGQVPKYGNKRLNDILV